VVGENPRPTIRSAAATSRLPPTRNINSYSSVLITAASSKLPPTGNVNNYSSVLSTAASSRLPPVGPSNSYSYVASTAASRRLPSRGYGNTCSSVASTAQKRHLVDDWTSRASKVSRAEDTTQFTAKTSRQKTRVRTNISIPKEDYFKPGTIIRADHFEEAYNQGSLLGGDKSIIHVPGEKDICKKARLFVVLAAHAMSYISLPLYSHNGNGTKNKPEPEEYVSIRDHRATIEAPAQSSHDPLLTADMSGSYLLTTSAVHLAYPVARSYSIPMEIVGRLKVSSTNHLIRLFHRYMPVELYEAPTEESTDTDVVIHANMSIADVLTSLQLDENTHFFADYSWSKAHYLNDKALAELGIESPEDRQKLARLFEKVKVARRAGDGWKLAIKKDSLSHESRISQLSAMKPLPH
jgi:hypothetical protein